jgi:hypothetical protein
VISVSLTFWNLVTAGMHGCDLPDALRTMVVVVICYVVAYCFVDLTTPSAIDRGVA